MIEENTLGNVIDLLTKEEIVAAFGIYHKMTSFELNRTDEQTAASVTLIGLACEQRRAEYNSRIPEIKDIINRPNKKAMQCNKYIVSQYCNKTHYRVYQSLFIDGIIETKFLNKNKKEHVYMFILDGKEHLVSYIMSECGALKRLSITANNKTVRVDVMLGLLNMKKYDNNIII
jgi:hypothetical protein